MKKKDFDWGVLLLPLVYLLFAAALFIGFMPEERKAYLSAAEVRAAFSGHFEDFDQTSRVLWEHPGYFDYLYGKNNVRGLLLTKKDALEKYSGGGYLTEAEWDRLKALCEIIQPYKIAAVSYDNANAIQWMFTVRDSNSSPYSLDLYYVRVPDAASPEKERDVSEDALSYLGRFGALSPIEGKDFWYESTIVPNNNLDKNLKTKFSE